MKKHLQRIIANKSYPSFIVGILIIAGVTFLGVHYLIGSHAATPSVVSDAANGTLNSNATIVTDGTAASGSAVKFGTSGPASVSAPTDLQLNDASTTEAALTWTPSTTAGVTYNILRNGQNVGTTNSYTSNFLNSGLTPGTTYTYTITAQVGSTVSSPSSALSVTTGSGTTAISSCESLASSTNYVLTSNLSVTPTGNQDCLNASNANHFSLDCQGHTLTLINSTNPDAIIDGSSESNFLITNCTFNSATSSPSYFTANLHSLANATFENNTFGASYSTYSNYSIFQVQNGASNFVFNNNTFPASVFALSGGDNTYIGNNNFSWPRQAAEGQAIGVGSSTDDIIYNNTIDGGSPNGANDVGLDGGIIIGGMSASFIDNDDTIAYNTISNTFDDGIEVAGTLNNSLITHNTITDTFVGGIDAYYDVNWTGNTISNNTYTFNSPTPAYGSSQWPQLFFIYDADGDSSVITFKDNNFINNTFDPGQYNQDNLGAYIDFAEANNINQPVPNSTLSNNTFTGNNFTSGSSSYNPIIVPNSMVIDGGSNICGTTIDPHYNYGQPLSVLVCNQ